MVMIFQSKKALRELLDSGIVYTFRLFPFVGPERKLGKDWITYKRGGKKLGDVLVSKFHNGFPPNALQLNPFVRYSGFDSVDEWIDEIKRLSKPDPEFDYHGEVLCIHLIETVDDLVSKYINGELD